MVKKGPEMTCPNCKEKFQISKSASDGDLERCPSCDAKVEIFKKGRKLDVRLIESERENLEIEVEEWDFEG